MARWIERQRSILDFTLSSFMRRKGRNISLFLVYTLVVFMTGSLLLFTKAMKREASLVLKDAPEMVVQRLQGGRYDPIPAAYAEKIGQIRGVASARPRLWGYYFDPAVGANYTVMAPRNGAPPEAQIVVGNGIARTRKVFQGDRMSFRGYDGVVRGYKVAGTLPAESELVSADLILISEAGFRELFQFPEDLATDIAVTVRNYNELPTIAKKVVETVPDARPILRDEILRTYQAIFDWRGGVVMIVFTMVLLAFVIFAWDKASGLSAEERREIGILKALGWETSDIIAVKTYEGLFVSFFSFSAGLLVAYLHVFFSSAWLFAPALKGWSVLYPEFTITPFVDPGQVAILLFLTVVPYTVATIVPSWRAAIVDPDAVMRS